MEEEGPQRQRRVEKRHPRAIDLEEPRKLRGLSFEGAQRGGESIRWRNGLPRSRLEEAAR